MHSTYEQYLGAQYANVVKDRVLFRQEAASDVMAALSAMAVANCAGVAIRQKLTQRVLGARI